MKKKSLHILHLIPNLNLGGAEKFVCDLSNQLLSEKVQVSLIIFYDLDDDNFLLRTIKNKINIITLSKKRGFDFRLILRIRKEISILKPDLIHTHLRSINYLVFSIFFKKIKVVHTVHNHAQKEVNSKIEGLFRKICFTILNIYPVTISEQSNLSFINFYNSKFIKSKLIYNGRSKPEKSSDYFQVDNYFKKIQDKYGNDVKILVNIGRIENQKNHLLLNDAILMLQKKGLNIVVIIIGGKRGNVSELIMKKIYESRNDRLLFLGEVNNPTDYLLISDYFILSSVYEGMPISLIEAFACSCIPISTPVGAIPEMINNDGFLSKSLLIEDFVDSIQMAIEATDDTKQKILENNLKKYHDLFSISSTAKNYLDYYNKVYKNKL
ncbi:MAG: hypothetical protein CMG01_01525 [Candidatus Marinimicrobia bacterium]|nr:hypothetical protein [Candidatus Neomarinimicrobiota bacterium]|tara:strand:- start:9412 stop:10554 length:1143 start_codon:yes stop_codon:yes gene_type:complete